MGTTIDGEDSTDKTLGNSSQLAPASTVLGYLNSLYQHIHKESKVYPSLASGVTVTGGVASWALGSKATLIPENTITSMFDIHYINIEEVSATDVYEMVLYTGTVGNEVEIGRVRMHKNSVQSGANNVPIQIPPQVANSRISVAIASSGGGSDTTTISVHYHIYG